MDNKDMLYMTENTYIGLLSMLREELEEVQKKLNTGEFKGSAIELRNYKFHLEMLLYVLNDWIEIYFDDTEVGVEMVVQNRDRLIGVLMHKLGLEEKGIKVKKEEVERISKEKTRKKFTNK